MIYKAATGSIYLPMCNRHTGELFKGRFFLYGKEILIYLGNEDVSIKQMIGGSWITKKIAIPIFGHGILRWEDAAVQIGDHWIIPSELFD